MSGKTKEYLFSPSESAGDIANFVFENWPGEWEDEAVTLKTCSTNHESAETKHEHVAGVQS